MQTNARKSGSLTTSENEISFPDAVRQTIGNWLTKMTEAYLWAADGFNHKALLRTHDNAGRIAWSDHRRGWASRLPSPKDRSVEESSWIALDIEASQYPEGFAPWKRDWKCEISQNIVHNLFIDFWHYWCLSVLAYLCWSSSDLEWHNKNVKNDFTILNKKHQ